MKIQNLDRLKKKLAELPKVARQEMRKALDQSAAEIVDLQRRFAPVQSGDLRDSIDYTFGAFEAENSNVRGVSGGGGGVGDPDLTVTIHAGDAKAYYAAFVEFGTAPHVSGGKFAGSENPGTTAQPFFYPGFRLGKKKTKSRIARAATKAARRVAGK
jgi:HK97 gp10 family phage protein